MKRSILLVALFLGITVASLAQENNATVIKLDQLPGKFKTEELTLKPGKYIFEVSNVGVDHELGFVIAPVDEGKEGDHIKTSYLAKTIKNGETSRSQIVILAEGTYNYFCPLNPTPHYQIIVKDK
ncbi:MAG TPA: plastocyanin/azurin family copper-binding protein [Roseivirga sp.]